MTYRVVGIDYSLTSAGITRVVGGKIEQALIKSTGHKGDGLALRLERIRSQVRRITEFALDGYDPNAPGPLPLFVIEAPTYNTPMRTDAETGKRVPIEGGGHEHDRSGAWWLIVHLLAKQGLIAEASPTAVKKYITGTGNASKEAVLIAAVRAFPDVPVSNNDLADSLVLAAMGCRQLGQPIEPSRTRITALALDRVRWPQLIERGNA